MVPEGTTWLDIATLVVAIGGIALGVINVVLRVRRDRADIRHSVRMNIRIDPRYPDEHLCVDLTNPGMRRISIVRAGFAQERRGPYPAFTWDGMFQAPGGAAHIKERAPVIPAPLPATLESGMPAHRLSTPVWRVRNQYNKITPAYVWCEDSYGTVYFEPLSPRVVNTIRATKRRVRGPVNSRGEQTYREIGDDERMDLLERL